MGAYYSYYCPELSEHFDGGPFSSDDANDQALRDAWNAKRPASDLVMHVLYELMAGPWRGCGVLLVSEFDCLDARERGEIWVDVHDRHTAFLRAAVKEFRDRETLLAKRDEDEVTSCLSMLLTQLDVHASALLEPANVDKSRRIVRHCLERLIERTR